MQEQQVDKELVAQTQQGKRTAFDLLVLKYQHRVAKLISRYVHDPSQVMDITQEAFIKAYRGIGNFRNDSAFYTWLYRIAINTMKTYKVSNYRHSRNVDLNEEEIERVAEKMNLREKATPEHFLLRDEIEATVFKTVEELPEELKTVLILREMEGFSYDEIANIMECPIGTVRSRLFRAREAVDEQIKPLMEDGDDD